MSDNIEIRIDDKASGSSDKITSSLIKMADASDLTNTRINQLKKTLGSLGSNNGLAKLNSELSKMLPTLDKLQSVMGKTTNEAAKLALANQKLATEQAKTANATAKAVQSQNLSAISLQKLATEQNKTASAAAKVAEAQAKAAVASQRVATEQARTAAAEARAEAATLRLDVAMRKVSTSQQAAAASSEGLSLGLGAMARNAAAIVGIGFGAKEALDTANAYTTLQNKLQIVSDSQSQVNELTERLGEVSVNTRSDLESTVTSFARFDAALQSLGKSQEESLRLTETVNKLFVIGGATAAEQAGALIQLSQAFNANVLQGEEYRSLAENMPKAVRTAIAEVLKINESALKKAASDGKITGQVLFEAFKRLDQFADSKFAKTVPTLGQAMNVFRTEATLAAGELDKTFGVTSAISQGIIFLGSHLRELSVVFAIAGAASVVAFGPSFVAMLATARSSVIALTLAMASNPFGAIAIAATGLAAYIALMGDEVKTSGDNFVTLKDVAIGSLDVIADKYKELNDVINNQFIGAMDTAEAKVSNSPSIFETALDGIANLFKNLINYIIGSFNAAAFGIVEIFSATPNQLFAIFELAARGIIQIIEDMLNLIGSGINQLFSGLNDLASKVGFDQIFNTDLNVDLSKAKDLFHSAGDDYATQMLNGMTERLGKDYIGDVNKAINQASQGRAVDRLINDLSNNGPSTLRGSGVDTTGKTAAKVKKHKKTDLEKATDTILKEATGGLKEYNLQMTAANNLLSKGLITREQYDKVTLKITEAHKNAIDPLREINKNLSQQEQLLNTATPLRETAQQMQQIENDLLTKGVLLNKEQSKALQDRIQKMQELKAVSGYMDQNYNQNKGAIQQLGYQQTANTNSFANGDIGLDQYTKKLADINVQMAQLRLQMGDGSFADGMVASLGKITDGFESVATGLTDSFGDFFSSFTKGFADSVGKAIVQGDSLRDSLHDVAQTVLSQLISSLIQLGIQYAVNASLAAAFGASTTAASVGMATATAAAWATPAALVSLASFGANAVPANAGIASTVALSSSLAAFSGVGFMSGGYTGNGATDAIAGAVHGQEYVFDAASTKALGVDNLEALRNGAKSLNSNNGRASSGSSMFAGMGGVNIEVQNNGTPQQYQAEQIDENTIRLIARDEASQEVKKNAGRAVAGDLRNPNSAISKGVTTNTTATRRR